MLCSKFCRRWKVFGQKLIIGARLEMGYLNNYDIPRSVMYDKHSDENNPVFDLNRDLIKQLRDITIITQDNIEETVEKILDK